MSTVVRKSTMVLRAWARKASKLTHGLFAWFTNRVQFVCFATHSARIAHRFFSGISKASRSVKAPCELRKSPFSKASTSCSPMAKT